jgi:hypothetical protein
MGYSDWRRVEELFQAAIDLDPSLRGDYLDSACQADLELRRCVQAPVRSSGGSRRAGI